MNPQLKSGAETCGVAAPAPARDHKFDLEVWNAPLGGGFAERNSASIERVSTLCDPAMPMGCCHFPGGGARVLGARRAPRRFGAVRASVASPSDTSYHGRLIGPCLL